MAWSYETSGNNESWVNLTSHTTAQNTSRFLLLSGKPYIDRPQPFINMILAVRSIGRAGRGASFVVTTRDPVRLMSDGDPTI